MHPITSAMLFSLLPLLLTALHPPLPPLFRLPQSPARRSTSHGPLRPTTLASPATRYFAMVRKWARLRAQALATPAFLPARSIATASLQTTLQATLRVSRQHRVPSRSARAHHLSLSAVASLPQPISTSAAAHQQDATKLGTESIGSLGTVIGGPTTAGGHTWWQVSYDNGTSGWSIGDYLLAAAAASSPAVGMAEPAQGSLTLIQQLLQQVQSLSLQLQSLRSQVAGAGAAQQ
jgi:hypothetical protein